MNTGTWRITWYVEMMRTTAGGGNMFAARLRDFTAGLTRGFTRRGAGVSNGPNGGMPGDNDFFLTGDILQFGGTAHVNLPGGVQTFHLEYALSTTSPSVSEVLRVRRQFIEAVYLGP
jgi:hypothetical protein